MTLLDSLMEQLSGAPMKALANQIGADPGTAQKATTAVLPILLEALGKNASRDDGANQLAAALDRDHDGGLLENLTGLFEGRASGQKSSDGVGILRHLLGSKQGDVEAGISRSLGLDARSVGKLLPMLAPVLMAALGKNKREKGLDLGGLKGMLSNEAAEVRRKSPESSGLLGRLLDQDGDGDFDLADAAKGLFRGLSR